MDHEISQNFYQSMLLPGEMVLWHGKPGPGKLNSYGLVPVVFSIFWLGFSLFWEAMAIMSGVIPMILFGIPFVLIGLSITFGGPIKNARLKGRIAYAVTDQRLLVQEGNEIRVFTPEMLPPMQIRMNKNGTGSIYFAETYYSRRNGNQYHCLCPLQNLTDVGRAQSALTTMLSEK